MSEKTNLNKEAAHKYFSTNCFNQAWDLIDKDERTPAEEEQMIRLSLASHYHWTQRADYTEKNASIAYWQTSHIFALLGQTDNALRYGQLCLEVSQTDDMPPFYLGYAYEALARAEAVGGDREKTKEYISQAKSAAEKIEKPEDKKQLLSELETI